MKRNYLIFGILILSILLNIGLIVTREKHRSISYIEAGTDFTKKFNPERIKRRLPIIPDTWKNVNPLHYKIQTWENPDTIIPRYSEKLVAADAKAQISHEIDRYDLRKICLKDYNLFYQIVVEYNYVDDTWDCTLRNTQEPERSGDLKGIRFAGDVICNLTMAQVNDTLKTYGLTRLNYK